MNYSKAIEQAVEYIEDNIKINLTPELIASRCGYSVFHFCRVFAIEKDITLMEYVKKRKLALAAIDMFNGKRIIDIAMEYGFDTHNGFSKAFKKEYGFSPTQYIKRMEGYFEKESILKIGGYIMNPNIVTKPAFKVVGYGIKTNISNGSYTKDVASFWSNYEGENLETKLYSTLNPPKHGEIGLCIPCQGGDEGAIYLLGVMVENFENATEDMIKVEVPEATYAVFTTPPVDTTREDNPDEFPGVIRNTWKYIFEKWFKDNDYIFDESKMDFEFYDERCHWRKDTVMDIYVPIIKK